MSLKRMNMRPGALASCMVALLGFYLPAAVSGQDEDAERIFANDFQSEAVGAETGTDPSGVDGFRPAFAGGTVLDDTTATPFGVENQFLEVSKTDPAGIRTLVHTTAVPSATYLEPTLIACDLFDPGTGTGRMLMGLGTGNPWVPEFNDTYMVIGLQLSNGALSAGINTRNVTGSLPTLDIASPYRLFMLTNLSDAAYSFTDPNGTTVELQPGQMEVWLYDYTDESYAFGGVWETARMGEDYDGEQGVLGFGFRQFSGDDQTLYLDNMLIDATPDWSVSDFVSEEPIEPEIVYTTGFETEAVGAVTGTDPSEVEGFRSGFAGGAVLDDATAMPFGPENQFLEVSKTDPAGIRTIVHTSAVPSATYLEPALVAYDLYDPGTGTGQMLMGLGTGNPWVPEYNDTYMVIGLRFSDGTLSAGINTTNVLGSLPAIESGKPYRLFMLTNLSDAAYSFSDPNGETAELQPGQMEVWVYDYMTESYAFGGVWETARMGEDYDGEQGVLGFGFRQFSGDDQVLYLDNMLIDATLDWSVSELDLPDPSEDLPWNTEGMEPGDSGHSPWFGSFELSTDDWLNHGELGWLYVGLVDSPDNLWIYSLFLEGWTWSDSGSFPVVYDVAGERWIYYLILDDLGIYLFDYSDGTWTLMP